MRRLNSEMLDKKIEVVAKRFQELQEVWQYYKAAENRFNWATGEDVDIAIYELIAAEKRLNKLLKELKVLKESGKGGEVA